MTSSTLIAIKVRMLAMQLVLIRRSLVTTVGWVAMLAVAVLTILTFFTGPAQAAMLVVNSTNDPGDGSCDATDCTLREALQEAAGNGQSDTITFNLPSNSTIVLDGSSLTIAPDGIRTLSIEGPGAGELTISGNGRSRVLSVVTGADATVSGVTIANGMAPGTPPLTMGGGIFVQGSRLTVENSTITNNSAGEGGGIFVEGGTLTVENSTITNNSAHDGGGLFVQVGSLTVEDSTISNNSASSGGGLFNFDGALTVDSSTIIGNMASEYGGGFTNITSLETSGTDSTIVTNSTISGNTANVLGGGVWNQGGVTSIRFSTITDNTAPSESDGGGVATLDALTRTDVRASIVAANTGADVVYVSYSNIGSFNSGGHNIIGSGNAIGDFTAAGDETGVTNPGLGPLQDNGGPTQTHALQSGSPALDRVPVSACNEATDQRGISRPQGTACDTGSFELEAAAAEPEEPDVVCHRDGKGRAVATVKATPGHLKHLEDGWDTAEACPVASQSRGHRVR